MNEKGIQIYLNAEIINATTVASFTSSQKILQLHAADGRTFECDQVFWCIDVSHHQHSSSSIHRYTNLHGY